MKIRCLHCAGHVGEDYATVRRDFPQGSPCPHCGMGLVLDSAEGPPGGPVGTAMAGDVGTDQGAIRPDVPRFNKHGYAGRGRTR